MNLEDKSKFLDCVSTKTNATMAESFLETLTLCHYECQHSPFDVIEYNEKTQNSNFQQVMEAACKINPGCEEIKEVAKETLLDIETQGLVIKDRDIKKLTESKDYLDSLSTPAAEIDKELKEYIGKNWNTLSLQDVKDKFNETVNRQQPDLDDTKKNDLKDIGFKGFWKFLNVDGATLNGQMMSNAINSIGVKEKPKRITYVLTCI